MTEVQHKFPVNSYVTVIDISDSWNGNRGKIIRQELRYIEGSPVPYYLVELDTPVDRDREWIINEKRLAFAC